MIGRGDLTERELAEVERWARTVDDEHGRLLYRVLTELRQSREREAATRFLTNLEQEY